jgi:peptide maturation system protein (TIGR04066 family)
VKKIVFFPHHPDLITLIDHNEYLKEYKIAGFISYKEDENIIHQLHQSLGLEHATYDQLLQNCDAVILIDNYRDYKTDKYYEVIQDAISYQKEVYVTPLAEKQLNLESYQGKYQLLELLPEGVETIEEEYRHMSESKLYDINVPIIGVIAQGKNCNKFENQLLLQEVVKEEYETITITTNALGALFGCYTTPAFLYEDRPFQEKIFKYNCFIHMISKLGKPDVIILGIPEGITPFRRQEFHHFAEYPLVISTAVPIDTAVLCTYFIPEPVLEDGLKKLVEYCQIKFNIHVGAIAISQTAFDIADENERIIFEFLSKTYLSKYYPDMKNYTLPLINMLDHKEAAAIIKKSLICLQENVKAI